MAVAKIHAIKSTVGKAIDYITNPEKTILADGTQLVSSYGCATETADIEFKLSSNLAKELNGDYTNTGGADNLAYHVVQSFSLSDNEKVTPERIHELGIEFADKFLKGKHEYVIATHIDKGHIHNHIIFNATSYKDYKKFRSQPFKTVAQIREISDKICEENGLSVIQNKGIGKSYKEWQVTKDGNITWKDTIKNKIDELIPKVNSYKEFVSEMKKAGFTIKEGKHIAFKAPEQERFVRGKRIGENYTKDKIVERISTEKTVEKTIFVTIDKRMIFKTLTDGFILNVPKQDYLLYLNGSSATLVDNEIKVNLNKSEYTIFNKNLTPAGSISAEQVRSDYAFIENIEIETNDKGEIPIAEYLKIRQREKKYTLHKVAQAVAYSRTEGVVYFSDFARRIKDLKAQADDTKHTLMKLDDKIVDIKNIGKLLITYQKYLPLKQELESIKFLTFKKKKFESKNHLELASFTYADETLRSMGVNPDVVNKEDLLNQIRENDTTIKEYEQAFDNISQRVEKLNNAQTIVDDFINNNSGEQIRNRSVVKKKDDINL